MADSSRVRPAHSKSAVNKAGDAVRSGLHSIDDERIVENWRASHGVVLNTFRQTLNRHAKSREIVVAQRLKRRNTIYDKLNRQPGMQLSRMQDIAGCRLIFRDNEALHEFRSILHASRFKHSLKNDIDDYDYLKFPKASGYRGIHDVYRYQSFSGLVEESHWDGLLIEIQYRTQAQHAWATAVELYDAISHTRAKFSEADTETIRYFQICSEILARSKEGMTGILADLTTYDLLREARALDDKLGVLEDLSKFPVLESDLKLLGASNNPFAIIAMNKMDSETEEFSVYTTKKNISSIIDEYFRIEKLYPDKNVVLVHARNLDETRSAFRNYFRDANDFVKMVYKGMIDLAERESKRLAR